MSFRKLFFATAALAGTAPALASTIDVTYSGIVSDALGTMANSGYTDGEAISGSFVFDTTTDTVTGATLGTFAAPPTSANNTAAEASLSSTDAIYQQGLYVGEGDAQNWSISVDFSALTSFSGTDPGAFLEQGTAALDQEIDFSGVGKRVPQHRGISRSRCLGR